MQPEATTTALAGGLGQRHLVSSLYSLVDPWRTELEALLGPQPVHRLVAVPRARVLPMAMMARISGCCR